MSLNIGKLALSNAQVGLDIVGKNIAHSNDENYVRERLHVTSTTYNATIARVEQLLDNSLEKDAFREKSRQGYYTKQLATLTQIENSINELSDSDISSALDNFYGELNSLSLNPSDTGLKEIVLQKAIEVTDTFQSSSITLNNLHQRIDQEINDHAEEINGFLDRIATLNTEISSSEGGIDDDPATNSRNQRRDELNRLSELINITTTELSNGSVLVQSDGRTLVFQGEQRGVYADRSEGFTRLRFSSDHAYLEPSGGSLGGLVSSRNEILDVRQKELNDLASDFIWLVNRVHSTGRGSEGLTHMKAETKIDLNFIDKPLNSAPVDTFSIGNSFKPENGTITFEIKNESTGNVSEGTVNISLIGNNDTTLKSLQEQIQQVSHLSSDIDNYGRISITSDSGFSFFIKEDTSGVAAFLGMNSLFSGNSAANIKVDTSLIDNPDRLAVAKSDDAGDSQNLLDLIATQQTTIDNNKTFEQTYISFVSSIASQTSRVKALSVNQDRIVDDVLAQRNAISGVNLDEEAANLLKYQQSYQAAAQYIKVQNQVLDILLNII
jgi:flagellar hook-associated protein 1 FlgK